MPTFAYRAKEANGNVTTGEVEAASQQEAQGRVRALKLTILELAERKPGVFSKIKEFIPGLGKPPVTSKDLVLFSRQLSTLVSAGVPIVQSLAILQSQAENPAFRDVLDEVRADIEGGLSISDAL
jgi:type IV pilus assembly protein PilC